MGAPGEAFFCVKGHLYSWIDDDLYWDEDLIQQSKETQEEGCPCGAAFYFKALHYGSEEDLGLLPPAKELDEVYVRVKGAVDGNRQPVDAYLQRMLPKYLLPDPNLVGD